jgi:hypothetical protein
MRRSDADGLTLAAISGVERRRGGCASTFCGADRGDHGARATAAKTAPCSDVPKPLPVLGGGGEQAQKSAPIRKMQDSDAHPVAAVNLTASADLLW